MQRRSAQLAVAFDPQFRRQTLWDTPLDAALMTTAFPATSRNWLDTDETIEDVYDCTGEDLLIEKLTARFARLILDFDVDPNLLAGWLAFTYGVAAAPTGGTNQVWTITITGTPTAGSFQVRFTHTNNFQTSAAIAFNADGPAVQTALRAMANIGSPNVTVAGPVGGPWVVTAAGALIDQPLDNFEVVNALNAGATIASAVTTPGAGRTHNISRLALYQLPFTTLYVGYRNSDKQPLIFKNVVGGEIRVRANPRGIVTASLTLIGSADLAQAVGYSMPPCLDIDPARFGDCDVLAEGESLYTAGPRWTDLTNTSVPPIRDWEYYYQNDILTGDHAFTGQGIDVTRLERADRRPSGINFGALGEEGDPLWIAGKQVLPHRYITPVSLRIGPANNFVRCNIPQAILKTDNPSIRHEGEANESHLRMIARPKKSSGDATTPSNITAVTTQQTAYLVAA